VVALVELVHSESFVRVSEHVNVRPVVQVDNVETMDVVVRVEFVRDQILFAKMGSVLVHQTAAIVSVVRMGVQDLVDHAEVMRCALRLVIVFWLVEMDCVIIQQRTQQIVQLTALLVVTIFVMQVRH